MFCPAGPQPICHISMNAVCPRYRRSVLLIGTYTSHSIDKSSRHDLPPDFVIPFRRSHPLATQSSPCPMHDLQARSTPSLVVDNARISDDLIMRYGLANKIREVNGQVGSGYTGAYYVSI